MTGAPAVPVVQKAACYGCGADIQTRYDGAAGYVEPERYKEKILHRQLDQLLCKYEANFWQQALAVGHFLPTQPLSLSERTLQSL